MASRVVVITGMHRSGTSLAASLLQRAGVHVGDRLLEPDRGNPYGFFEDVEVLDFQDRLLKDRGRTILVDGGFVYEPTLAESERAEQLIAERRIRRLWGWKDPRTALFLEFWDERLEGARYFFVFRQPFDVLLSLIRRTSDHETLGLSKPVEAWETYNSRIRAFYRKHEDRCALVHVDALSDAGRLNDVLRSKLGLDVAVSPEAVAELYRADALHTGAALGAELFGLLVPSSAALYEELLALADLKPSAPAPLKQSEVDELAELRQAVERLLPDLGPHRRGLLLTLLEIAAPDEVEAAFRRHDESFFELYEGNQWLEEQRQSWERVAGGLARQLEHRSIRGRIGRLLGLPERSAGV